MNSTLLAPRCLPWIAALALALVVLPWINPWFWGPVPNVPRVWLAVLCGVGLFSLLRLARATPAQTLACLAWGWLLAAALSAGIGLCQYLGVATPLGVFPAPQRLGEAYGNLHQRNLFATQMNIGLAALLWRVGAQPAVRRDLAWMAALAILLATANAASSSRVGLLNLVLLAGLSAWWQRGAQRNWPLRLALLALLAYGLALLLLPVAIGLSPGATGILARLQAQDAACSSRIVLWSNVLHLIAQKPWVGWGWGELAYAHFITLYPGDRFCDILDNAHNLPLHLAVELGLPLAALLCGLVLWWVWRARPWAEVAAQRQLAWSVLLVLGLHSLLEYPLWYGPFLLAALWALWLLAPPWRLTTGWAGLLAAFVLALGAYALWDYWRISQLYLPEEERALRYQGDGIAAVHASRLYAKQVQFADLNVTALRVENAALQHAQALAMLHVSPEPWVIERVLDSAALLGRTEAVDFYAARYQAAFASAFERWQAGR